jgi:hypothetical protein
VSCPDWRVLRDDEAGADAVAAARRHLAECAQCRRQALACDPTLLFAVAPPVVEASDELVRQMRERVAGARALRRVGRSAEPSVERVADGASRRVRPAARWAAAVLLPLAGLGLVQVGADPSARPAGRGADPSARPADRGAEILTPEPDPSAVVDPLVAEALARLPLIEGPSPVRFQEEGIGYDLVVVDTGSGL